MIRNVELRVTDYVRVDDVDSSKPGGGSYSIYDVGNTISYTSLDLFENETINITLQNQDINDFSKAKINFSKTFNLPATNKNNFILVEPGLIAKGNQITFQGREEIENKIDTFNYPIPAQIWVDGDLILEGTLNVKSVNRNTTPSSYECIFTTDLKSVIPLLKQQAFSMEYFPKPINDYLLGYTQSIIPANFIWDSILFENYIYTDSDDINPNFLSKNQLLPVTGTPSFYPRYIKQDLPDFSDGTNFLNHIVSSWTQSNSKFYWGIIDDGTRPYVNSEVSEYMRTNQVIDKTHKIPSQLLLAAPVKYSGNQTSGRTGRISSIQSYQPFRDIRPYYYVSDVFGKIFRWLEYKLNGEYFNYTTLKNTFPQYTNYDKPGITYSNTPIRFSFDTNILGSASNPNLSDYVFIAPENDLYPNGQINMQLVATLTSDGPDVNQMVFVATASIIKNAVNLSTTASNWDQYGITYLKVHYSGYGPNGNIKIVNTVEVDDYKIPLPAVIIPTNLPTTPFYYTFGIGTFSSLPNEVKNNLPTGHTQSNYINLLTLPNFDVDKWKYYYINANNLGFGNTGETVNGLVKDATYNLSTFPSVRIKPLYNFTTTSDPIQSATFGYSSFIKQDVNLYDLRRYVYPQLDNYSMGDFIQDTLKTFNVKIEEPLIQNTDTRLQLKTFNKYITDTINKFGIKDLSKLIAADKMKITKTQYGLVNLKNEEQNGDLVKLFFLSDFDKTGYGDYYEEFLSYNNNDKKLEVKTKLSNGVSNYLMTSYSERYYALPFGVPFAIDINAYGIVNKKSNKKPVQVHSILSYNDYNPQKDYTVLLNNRSTEFLIRDYDVKKTKPKPFFLFNDRDPRVDTNLSGVNVRQGWSFSTTYSVCQIHTGRITIMPYDTQSACGLFPTLTNYDKNGNSLLYDFTNGNQILDSATSSLYTTYYEPEIDNINGLYIIDTEINMNMTEFNEFTFAQLWKLKIQGEYKLFRINRLTDYTLNDDSLTKVQLIEIPNISNFLAMTASYTPVDFGPSLL